MNFWVNWVRDNFSRLIKKEWLEVPEYLPHPLQAGFYQLSIAENYCQINNYAISLSDGSRLHVHEYKDGRLIIHRDKYDPDKGIVDTTLHFFTETNIGKTVGIGIVMGILGTVFLKGK
jgi:hypothetical protein